MSIAKGGAKKIDVGFQSLTEAIDKIPERLEAHKAHTVLRIPQNDLVHDSHMLIVFLSDNGRHVRDIEIDFARTPTR